MNIIVTKTGALEVSAK